MQPSVAEEFDLVLLSLYRSKTWCAEHVFLLDQAAPISVIQWVEFARIKASLHRTERTKLS